MHQEEDCATISRFLVLALVTSPSLTFGSERGLAGPACARSLTQQVWAWLPLSLAVQSAEQPQGAGKAELPVGWARSQHHRVCTAFLEAFLGNQAAAVLFQWAVGWGLDADCSQRNPVRCANKDPH